MKNISLNVLTQEPLIFQVHPVISCVKILKIFVCKFEQFWTFGFSICTNFQHNLNSTMQFFCSILIYLCHLESCSTSSSSPAEASSFSSSIHKVLSFFFHLWCFIHPLQMWWEPHLSSFSNAEMKWLRNLDGISHE